MTRLSSTMPPRFLRCLAAGAMALLFTGSVWADYAYALWGQPKYPEGFAHFDYVNPDAPVGGELRLVSNVRSSTFDKYNPFTLRGSAPAYLQVVVFESLLAASLDETATGYGLLAESVEVAPDHLSATFQLRPEARFHNGKPVLAEDVRYSFETLISAQASPLYASVYADVEGVQVLGERTVRFTFKALNRELPLLVGSMPIFSRDWGVGEDGVRKPFDQIITDTPIGSGPYKIGPVVFGRDITYVRDPHYWGQNLNVNVGSNLFERITIRIYKDNTARLEALKAGEFDMMQMHSAGDWARRLTGRRFDSGELLKKEFAHQNPSGFQAYFLNTRRPLLQDVRVRQALALAMDYEWMKERLFYNAYERVHGIFGKTQCAAEGSPDAEQLALLAPWRDQLQPVVFGPIAQPPRTDDRDDGLRLNLRQAQALLAEAGWNIQNGVLRNAQGQAFVIEVLDSNDAGIRAISPWMRNLRKLGIEMRFRVADFALMQQRLDDFDFDITSLYFPGRHNPGQEFSQLFGSAAAQERGGMNYTGLQNPAVDALIQQMVRADTEPEYLAACRALERVVVSEHVLVPAWFSNVFRVVYNTKHLAYHAPMPAYVPTVENWVMFNWWAKPDEN